METMVRATMLTGYFQVARRHGLNPLDLLREVGLDAGLLVNRLRAVLHPRPQAVKQWS